MQVNDLTPERLRELAEVRPPHGRVLSLYLDLNPSEFATGADKASAVRSLLDDADRQVREVDGLSHDEERLLRGDLERARGLLEDDLPTKGVHGLAVFVSTPADLFEALRLPTAVQAAAVIDDRPHIEPLAALETGEPWLALMVNRRHARVLRGSTSGFRELGSFTNDLKTRGSQQAGHLQARHDAQGSQDVHEHYRHVSDVLLAHLKRVPFDHLLLLAPEQERNAVEAALHAYLRERLVAHVDVDIEVTPPDQVLEQVKPEMERFETRREREALDRMLEGVGRGTRGAAGLEEVLAALVEQRVASLLVEPGFTAPGVLCPTCGWMGTADASASCPVDGAEVQGRDDIVEPALQAAIRQSAEIVTMRHHEDLGSHGSIGAVLHF